MTSFAPPSRLSRLEASAPPRRNKVASRRPAAHPSVEAVSARYVDARQRQAADLVDNDRCLVRIETQSIAVDLDDLVASRNLLNGIPACDRLVTMSCRWWQPCSSKKPRAAVVWLSDTRCQSSTTSVIRSLFCVSRRSAMSNVAG